jgi:hypothetical protein
MPEGLWYFITAVYSIEYQDLQDMPWPIVIQLAQLGKVGDVLPPNSAGLLRILRGRSC